MDNWRELGVGGEIDGVICLAQGWRHEMTSYGLMTWITPDNIHYARPPWYSKDLILAYRLVKVLHPTSSETGITELMIENDGEKCTAKIQAYRDGYAHYWIGEASYDLPALAICRAWLSYMEDRKPWTS